MTAPPFHRKIGGIHWFALGRVRISICLTAAFGRTRARRPTTAQPDAIIEHNGVLHVLNYKHKPPPAPCFRCGGERKLFSPPDRYECTQCGILTWKGGILRPKPRLPRTTLFPWPPETKL